MSAPAPKPFSLQAPERIAMEYGGNKQKIAQAVQSGLVDPTAGLLAGMFIDRMRSAQAQEQAPNQTVAQQVLGPQGPQGGPPPPPPPQGGPQGGPPGGPPPPPPPQGGPPPQGPVGMAEGGLTSLPVPDYMFDEQTFAGGGIVAFANGDSVADRFKGLAGKALEKARRVYYQSRVPGAPKVTAEQTAAYRKYAREKAVELGLDPDFVDRIFKQESTTPVAKQGYDPYAKSGDPTKQNPTGIGQFNSQMGRAFDLIRKGPFKEGLTEDRRTDPYAAIDASLKHIKDLEGKYDGDPTLMAVGYNQGEPTLNKNLKATNGVLDLNNFIGLNGKVTKEPLGYVTKVVPKTQVARNEPPGPSFANQALSSFQSMLLPGMPGAQAPTLAAETQKPKAQAQPPVEPYVDPVGKIPYLPMYTPLDPNKPMPSKAKRYADVASQFVGAGNANLFGALPINATAETINRTANFFTKPIDPNEGAPPADNRKKILGAVDRYIGPGNTKGVRHYTMGEDPAREAALASKPLAANPADAAPVGAAGPAKETAEEAMARILAANKRNNFLSAMAQAGFGMMAGTSPNALTNIGAGLSAALPGMSAANRSDQELALKQQEMAQNRDYQTKMLSAQTPTAIQQAEILTQNYVRQGLPLVVAKARATRDVMAAGADPYRGGSALSSEMKQLESVISFLKRTSPEDPRIPDLEASYKLARDKFDSMGSGGVGSGGLSGAKFIGYENP